MGPDAQRNDDLSYAGRERGFDFGPASLVTPVASASPVFAIGLAYLWLKEKVHAGQIALVLVVVGSLAGLSQ